MAEEDVKGAALDLWTPKQSELLPIEPTTGIPLPPRAQPGYYPGYSTLAQQEFWDEATRSVVLDRITCVPPLRFFTAEESTLMQAVIDRVLPQDDRDAAHKIPILPFIDERLYTGRIDGSRYATMPPDPEAYRRGVQGIDTIAQHLYKKPFVLLDAGARDEVLTTIHDGNPPAGEEIWGRMSPKHYWSMLMQDAVGAYYAHPFAWDEIGFGGPAYPRGYMRQERGEPEPWEIDEQRYAWAPPLTALSVGDTTYGWAPAHPGDNQVSGGEGGTH